MTITTVQVVLSLSPQSLPDTQAETYVRLRPLNNRSDKSCACLEANPADKTGSALQSSDESALQVVVLAYATTMPVQSGKSPLLPVLECSKSPHRVQVLAECHSRYNQQNIAHQNC